MQEIQKKDIRQFDANQLKQEMLDMGQKSFTGKQIYEWLWQKSCVDFELMTNLSKSTRELLKEKYCINNIKIEDQQKSSDTTIKVSFKLFDNRIIEGVLIPSKERVTACISSQAGCALDCKFCATGKLGLLRNLNAGEIYDQVVLLKELAVEHYGNNLSNIVMMGMGEPLLNYKNVLSGIDKICSPTGLGMSSERITVSTAGVSKMIKRLADDETKFNLAISLHAATDLKRSAIMPINDSNNLSELVDAIEYYTLKSSKQVTFEYIAFGDFNVGIDDAKELLKICRKTKAKVNIIEYNPAGNDFFKRADVDELNAFVDYLTKHKINVRVRRSRGKDIDAACGQLANKKHEEALIS